MIFLTYDLYKSYTEVILDNTGNQKFLVQAAEDGFRLFSNRLENCTLIVVDGGP